VDPLVTDSHTPPPAISPSIESVCFGEVCFCGEGVEDLQACIENFKELSDNDSSIAEVIEFCEFGLNLNGCGGDSSASAITGTGAALGITCALSVLRAIGGVGGGGGKTRRRDARDKKD
jgi:hypothetical protein